MEKNHDLNVYVGDCSIIELGNDFATKIDIYCGNVEEKNTKKQFLIEQGKSMTVSSLREFLMFS